MTTTDKTSRQDNRCVDLYLNRVPPAYKADALTSELTYLVCAQNANQFKKKRLIRQKRVACRTTNVTSGPVLGMMSCFMVRSNRLTRDSSLKIYYIISTDFEILKKTGSTFFRTALYIKLCNTYLVCAQ